MISTQQGLLVQQATLIHVFLKAMKRHGMTLESILQEEEGLSPSDCPPSSIDTDSNKASVKKPQRPPEEQKRLVKGGGRVSRIEKELVE